MIGRPLRTLSPEAREARVSELVAAINAGSAEAWDELFNGYVALLWSIAYRHGLNETDAGDVVQTTWMRLVENIDRIREPGRLGAWLATTAQREALRCVTQNRKLVLSDDDEAFDGPDLLLAPLDEGLLARDQAEAAYAALGELPPAWRSLVERLTQDPPLSYEEIGRELDIPVGSIGPTRGRCIKRMRASFNAAT